MRKVVAIVCICPVLILLARAPDAAGTSPLQDRVDAVVVKGADLPADLIGGPIDSYRVLASDGSGLKVIPMQIDEIGKDGEFHWQVGPEAGGADNNFDATDELVFMAFDSGEAYSGEGPEGCGKTTTITLSDPATAAKGYVILARCENPPPLSSRVYVNADYDKNMIATGAYRLGWEKKLYYFYDYLVVGDGPDVIDRLQARITVGKFGINYVFNEEEHLKHMHLGYVGGPVRVVKKSNNDVTLGSFNLQLEAPLSFFFYRDYIYIIAGIGLDFNPEDLGLDFSIMTGHDMTLDKLAGKKRICINAMPECRDYDDKMEPEKIKQMAAKDTVWGGFEGPHGVLISFCLPEDRLSTKVRGIYVDDPEIKDPPETIKGENPLIGFNVVEWDDVEPGFYNIIFYHFFMPKYSVAEVDRHARLFNQPLSVSVK